MTAVPRRSPLLLLPALALAAGCGGSSGGSPTASVVPSTPPASTSAATSGPCQTVPAPSPSPQQFAHEPKVTIAHTTYTATVKTNCGTVVAKLDGKHAPHTVNSFFFLAAHHYFDNTICHRLTTQGIFVLQCGDPTGTGTGGPGYTIPDENLKGATYPAGTLAMANTGQPHTGGSQFFFCYEDTSLPPNYTPFGKVVQGLSVLQAIGKAGTATGGPDGAPAHPVVIESFTVVKG